MERYGALPGSPEAGHVAAIKQLWELAYREASTLAYADAFRAIMIAFAIATFLVPLMRNIAPSKTASPQDHRAATAGAHQPDRKSDLAGGGTRQKLAQRYKIDIRPLIEPAPTHDKLFTEIPDVCDRPAEAAHSEFEENEQHFERGAHVPAPSRNLVGGDGPRAISFPAGHAHQSRVGEERHESEVHVKLLVTVEECHPRIVSDEVKFHFLKAAHHHHVFHNTGCGLATNTYQLEAVPV